MGHNDLFRNYAWYDWFGCVFNNSIDPKAPSEKITNDRGQNEIIHWRPT